MIFRWWKNRRRRRLRALPWPDAWEEICRENVAAWSSLSEADRVELRALAQVFLAEKNWVGCAGLELDDEIRVTIAVQACLLLLGIEHDYYRKVKSVLVYPSTVYVPGRELRSGAIVSEASRPIAGLAAYGGPIVLSWDAVRRGGRTAHDGHNVVYHEFAHKLDMLDGWVDGAPPLRSREQTETWRRVMSTEYERLVAAARTGEFTLLDPYGATNPGEFFAVATECFYERATQFAQMHPELYQLLRAYYRRNPVHWGEEDATGPVGSVGSV